MGGRLSFWRVPLVKRKKGFLSPSFFQTHYFGLGTNIPYYYPLSDYSDVTVTPKISQKKFYENKNFFWSTKNFSKKGHNPFGFLVILAFFGLF